LELGSGAWVISVFRLTSARRRGRGEEIKHRERERERVLGKFDLIPSPEAT
jgi:hypothetical protein